MFDKNDIEEYLGYEIQDNYIVDYNIDGTIDIKVVKKQYIGTIICNIQIQKSGSVFDDAEH